MVTILGTKFYTLNTVLQAPNSKVVNDYITAVKLGRKKVQKLMKNKTKIKSKTR